jgi:hypothetical protein
LVTPLATNTSPLPSVTRLGYQRPQFMGLVTDHVSVVGSKIRVSRRPWSSANPNGVPGSRGSEYQSVPPGTSCSPLNSVTWSLQNSAPAPAAFWSLRRPESTPGASGTRYWPSPAPVAAPEGLAGVRKVEPDGLE